MTRLSVCSLGVSCNKMIDTPMLLAVEFEGYLTVISLIVELEQKFKVFWNGGVWDYTKQVD